ncbi:hypothetical protein AB1N83_012685 [Pleurotus pulmonarius]|nr:hypothetical protein EYR38_007341 [Pleurotus pulmonarius]
MSTQQDAPETAPTSTIGTEHHAQNPTPAQAAEIQAARASRKGKEPAAGRSVSDIGAVERRGRQYSPYNKRDKDDGEASREEPSQGGGEQGRGQHTIAPTNPTRWTPVLAPEHTPPRTGANQHDTPPALPPQTAATAQTAQPIHQLPAQLPIPLVTQAVQPNQDATMVVDQPENPHLQTTMAEPLTTIPPRPGKGYTGGPFPRTVIDSEDLFKSIRPEILQNLLEDPKDFLFLLPYGAGKRLHTEFPNLGDDILEYIKEFRAPNCEGLAVVRAASDTFIRGKKPRMYKNNFEAPWLFILSGFSPELRDFLLGVGVFDFVAGEANHAFTVLRIQQNVRSWHVAYLKGDGVTADQQMMQEGLTAIRTKLRDNDKVRTAVQECYAGRTDHNLVTTDDKVQDALSTLSITFTTDGNTKFWHLTAKPITDDPDKHHNWGEAIRDTKSYVLRKIFAVDVAWGFDRCDFCKNESHPESACPFPKVQGWKGPKPSEVRARWAKADRKNDDGGPQSTGRSQRGGRGNRGGRTQHGESSGGRGGFKRQGNRGRPY